MTDGSSYLIMLCYCCCCCSHLYYCCYYCRCCCCHCCYCCRCCCCCCCGCCFSCYSVCSLCCLFASNLGSACTAKFYAALSWQYLAQFHWPLFFVAYSHSCLRQVSACDLPKAFFPSRPATSNSPFVIVIQPPSSLLLPLRSKKRQPSTFLPK